MMEAVGMAGGWGGERHVTKETDFITHKHTHTQNSTVPDMHI